MPFGLWARMGGGNQMLDGGPEVLRVIAMATNFGTKIALCERQRLGNWLWRGFEWSADFGHLLSFTLRVDTAVVCA